MNNSPMSATSSEELVIGDRIEQQHGPFVATWEVVEIIDAGARLQYCGDVRFIGHRAGLTGANGEDLTADRMQSFLGRAHWPAATRVPMPGSSVPDSVADWDAERQRRRAKCVGGGMHAWREHGNPATGASFSACIACGVTQTDADYDRKVTR